MPYTHREVFDPRGQEGVVGSRGTNGKASSNRAAEAVAKKAKAH